MIRELTRLVVGLTRKLEEMRGQRVETRIAQQAAAFDPALEGYVVYAIGSRGKRLRPLLALLAGGATGRIRSGHIDLADRAFHEARHEMRASAVDVRDVRDLEDAVGGRHARSVRPAGLSEAVAILIADGLRNA